MTLRDLLLKVLSSDTDLDAKIVFEARHSDEVQDATTTNDDGDTVDKGVILPGAPVIVEDLSVNDDGEIVLTN